MGTRNNVLDAPRNQIVAIEQENIERVHFSDVLVNVAIILLFVFGRGGRIPRCRGGEQLRRLMRDPAVDLERFLVRRNGVLPCDAAAVAVVMLVE